MDELHLFILWENARYKEAQILRDLDATFQVVSKLDILWPQKSFSSNLSRFYGRCLPNQSFKEKHCGRGRFLALVISDPDPFYRWRKTSKGPCIVNANVFDKKVQYRRLTGGGHRVHATNNREEFNHDITLLLGLNQGDFVSSAYYHADKRCNLVVPGFGGWPSLETLFYVLNSTTSYVVLRHFEGLPSHISIAHGDIDLLVESKIESTLILNAEKKDRMFYRSRYKVKVSGEFLDFDIRCPGDGYYDIAWQMDILKRRKNKGWGYIPAFDDYRFSLLYHVLVHKKPMDECNFSDLEMLFPGTLGDERERLDRLVEQLRSYLVSNKYEFTRPKDYTVYYNEAYAAPLPLLSIRRIYQTWAR